MIAIMILGIGIVMVATVFPVGLEISRQPIQTYISMAVADTAAATLKTKVPAYQNLDIAFENPLPPPYWNTYQIIGYSTHRVLVPDVTTIEIDKGPDTGPCVINQAEYQVLDLSPPADLPGPKSPPSYVTWGPGWLGLDDVFLGGVQTHQEFIARTRVFTEHTGWAGELSNWTFSSVVHAQYLPAGSPATWGTQFDALKTAIQNNDLNAFLNLLPVTIHPSLYIAGQTGMSDLPRVNLVDQVYPPMTLYYPNGNPRGFLDVVVDGKLYPGVLNELLARRYSWAAIHHRMSTEAPQYGRLLTNRDLVATIATLHRADVGSRFARQASLDPDIYSVAFDINNVDDHKRAAYQPNADLYPATDAIFPLPWLVMLHYLDASNGRADCSPEVARILPTGSYFIIARGSGTLNSNNYYSAGTFFKVTQSQFDPLDLGSNKDPLDSSSGFPWTTIEIARSNITGVGSVPVWVFPPAVTNLATPRTGPATYEFLARSPVVGLDLRRISVR